MNRRPYERWHSLIVLENVILMVMIHLRMSIEEFTQFVVTTISKGDAIASVSGMND